MDISGLMVYDKKMKDEIIQRRNRNVRRPRSDYRNFSKDEFEVQDKPIF